jgi:RimJ/RimL family protein N-acetyltransferase
MWARNSYLVTHHTRPLFARVAKKNPASRRVAQKCGFKIFREDVYRNEAGKDVEEYILKLTAPSAGRRRRGMGTPSRLV